MSKIIAEILAKMAVALFDRIEKGEKYVHGKGPGKVEKKLRDKLKKHGWLAIIMLVLFASCTRVVYIPHGQSVQLRQDVKNVKVIPEGWYCLPIDE